MPQQMRLAKTAFARGLARNADRRSKTFISPLAVGVGQKIICPLECFEEHLMSLTEVASLSECCFVDSPGGGCPEQPKVSFTLQDCRYLSAGAWYRLTQAASVSKCQDFTPFIGF